MKLLMESLIFLAVYLGVEVYFLENLELEGHQLRDGHSARLLESQVIEIDVVVELDCQHQASKEKPMYVELVQAEFGFGHIVPIEIDYGQHQALRREVRVLVQTVKVTFY